MKWPTMKHAFWSGWLLHSCVQETASFLPQPQQRSSQQSTSTINRIRHDNHFVKPSRIAFSTSNPLYSTAVPDSTTTASTTTSHANKYQLTSLRRYEREQAGRNLEKQANDVIQQYINETKNNETMKACLGVLTELAQLGRAEACQDFSQQLLKHVQDANQTETQSSIIKANLWQCQLHAWSNKLRLVPRKSSMALKASYQAAEMLQQLLQNPQFLTSLEFEAILSNYLYVRNVDAACDLWNQWQNFRENHVEMDPPTSELSARLMRSLANVDANSWEQVKQQAAQAQQIGNASLNFFPDDQVEIYNAWLEVWSKALPPPSKQHYHKFAIRPEHRQQVGDRTQSILEQMKLSQIQPNHQTYATVLYAYCKCGWLPQAWEVWQEWKQLMSNSQDPSDVDVRCLRMLIQSSVRHSHETHENCLEVASQATEAVNDMWILYDKGYEDLKPDVILYTSLLSCWADPKFGSMAMETTGQLVDNLNARYQLLGWESLQPDMAFYNAWISVVRSQFQLDSQHENENADASTTSSSSVAEQASRIVAQMQQQSIYHPEVAPDTNTYNFLMDACLHDGLLDQAEQTLQQIMVQSSSKNSDASSLAPNGRSFASIIRAWGKVDTAKAEAWLDRMEERFVPSSSLFEQIILQCCEETMKENVGAAERKQQAERARRLLTRMEELSKATDNNKLRPSRSLYNSVVEAFGRCNDGTAMELDLLEQLRKNENEHDATPVVSEEEMNRIQSEEDVFRIMEEYGGVLSESDANEKSTRTFNMVIQHLASTGQYWAGQIAEEIFVYMLDQYLNNADRRLKPDIITFNSVISAWSKSKHPEAAIRAHAFLENLKGLHDGGLLLDTEADAVSYNTVIHAYQRSNKPTAGKEAERVFMELVALYQSTKDPRYRPDTVSYCSLLGAYADQGDAHRAEELLLQFHKEYKRTGIWIAPDTTCFDQVMRAWAKRGGDQSSRRAEKLLRLMEDMSKTKDSNVSPTTESYNIVLHALANSGDVGAPVRAQIILDKMKKGKPSIRPDTVTYTTIIAVMCRLAGRKALPSIRRLLDEAIATRNVRVNAPFFANILSSLALCSDSTDFAEELVEKRLPKLGLEPDIDTWNALANCYAKKGMGDEAEAMLDRLDGGPVRPNMQTYTIVLDAFAKSQSPDSTTRAESIIQRMQESTSFKPDAKAYTALIQKYARSNLPLKAKRAQAVLQTMKESAKDGSHKASPTVVTYNAILNACEYTTSADVKEKEEAFSVACLVFDEARKLKNPNHVTYGTFLGVVSNLMPKSDARNEIAELVFKRCCKDGQVSSFVLRKLKATVSLSMYRQLLAGKTEDRLPRKWTLNVRDRRSELTAVRNNKQSGRRQRA